MTLAWGAHGGEFDWLAHDAFGHVGYFSSAGFGPIPAALDEPDWRDINGWLAQLPVRGRANPLRSDAINITDWLDAASRGLFAYDWSHTAEVYFLVAFPTDPLDVHDLPRDPIGDLARATRLATRFPASNQLDPALYPRPVR